MKKLFQDWQRSDYVSWAIRSAGVWVLKPIFIIQWWGKLPWWYWLIWFTWTIGWTVGMYFTVRSDVRFWAKVRRARQFRTTISEDGTHIVVSDPWL